ncbi:MAG: SMC-Scp complex subunit ScpB [Alphaproteobacteria bacterium]|nr:MAG: SMC-Scp complex subunit ScpB [Alphaproteobacteria bacterium]
MTEGGNAAVALEADVDVEEAVLDEEVAQSEAAEETLADDTNDVAEEVETAPEPEPSELEKLKASYVLDLEHVRMAEALLFAAAEPLDERTLSDRMPDGIYFPAVLEQLKKDYAKRGVQLLQVGNKWTFRTAPDLSYLMEKERVEMRRLSRAGIETLAIIAYHQPVTRAEIEEIRGVTVSKGTIDVLMEIEWVRMRGRKRVPGRPVLYGTTDAFLEHFGLETVKDLPGMDELKAAGLLDARLPPGFSVPMPDDSPDEIDEDDEDEDSDQLFSGDLAVPFEGEEDETFE